MFNFLNNAMQRFSDVSLRGYYKGIKTAQPDAGAMAIAFSPHFTLPGFDIMGYSQYRVRGPLQELQPAQLWAHLAVPVSGVGGPVSGTIYNGPLFGPPETTLPL